MNPNKNVVAPIPDDLRERYERLKSYRPMELAVTDIRVHNWIMLIERIAGLEAENARLRETLKNLTHEIPFHACVSLCTNSDHKPLRIAYVAALEALAQPVTEISPFQTPQNQPS